MCWTKNFSSENEDFYRDVLSTAQEDIECFKVVGVRKLQYFKKFLLGKKKIFSFFRDYKYSLNKLYKIDEIVVCKYLSLYRVNRGFHSYSKYCSTHWVLNPFQNCILEVRTNIPYFKGIIATYPSESVHKKNLLGETKVVRCIIPKGSKYAINNIGEIVSDQIILKEIIE